jgi:hypothetical protein
MRELGVNRARNNIAVNLPELVNHRTEGTQFLRAVWFEITGVEHHHKVPTDEIAKIEGLEIVRKPRKTLEIGGTLPDQ